MKCYILSVAMYSAVTCIVQKVGLEYVESFEMWCCIMKISWTDQVRNEEML